MAAEAYLEKLRDPRWQKKRLEVFERDGWKCRSCDADDQTLNVHHWRYERGKEPWEYDLEDLYTLCDECHQTEHDERRKCEDLVISALKLRHWPYHQVHDLACAIYETPSTDAVEGIAELLCWFIRQSKSPAFVEWLKRTREDVQQQLSRRTTARASKS